MQSSIHSLLNGLRSLRFNRTFQKRRATSPFSGLEDTSSRMTVSEYRPGQFSVPRSPPHS